MHIQITFSLSFPQKLLHYNRFAIASDYWLQCAELVIMYSRDLDLCLTVIMERCCKSCNSWEIIKLQEVFHDGDRQTF